MSPVKGEGRPGRRPDVPQKEPSNALIDTLQREAAVTAQRQALGRLLELIDVGQQLRIRAVQQAIVEAEVWYWLQRSRDFAQVGTRECDLIAINCRNHARLLAGEFGDAGEPWPGFNDDLAFVLVERAAA